MTRNKRGSWRENYDFGCHRCEDCQPSQRSRKGCRHRSGGTSFVLALFLAFESLHLGAVARKTVLRRQVRVADAVPEREELAVVVVKLGVVVRVVRLTVGTLRGMSNDC